MEYFADINSFEKNAVYAIVSKKLRKYFYVVPSIADILIVQKILESCKGQARLIANDRDVKIEPMIDFYDTFDYDWEMTKAGFNYVKKCDIILR